MKILENIINEWSNGKIKEFDAIIKNVRAEMVKKHIKLNSLVMLNKLNPNKATFMCIDPQEYEDDAYFDLKITSAEYTLLKNREKDFQKYIGEYKFM
jgi:hypothetical protein